MVSETVSKGKGVEFFSAKNLDAASQTATSLKTERLEIGFKEGVDEQLFMEGSVSFAKHIKNVAFSFPDSGLHIGILELEPNLPSPLHSHSDDCAYYVEKGSLIMGNREIGAGEGFLTRKDQPYGFVVGPNGARIIEFTTHPRATLMVHDRRIAAWRERLDRAVERLDHPLSA
ncbi:cupin domain-containing protein [Sphingobium subterraneum]|uniref:Cupin 2 conserved barrel domain-containing protein n=1 Tax=Sphingobium subterraneum TaxID=627688 RepID=A0A841IZ34_9SPHN|nr:hypothetical protein [Sphingobium subterraneum]MBB6124219.1 hypothetical protein [Sphingobium subterraneum]